MTPRGQEIFNTLTKKERAIAFLISKGYRNKEIASTVNTTEQVVKNYLRSIYDKAGVGDRLAFAVLYLGNGMGDGGVEEALKTKVEGNGDEARRTTGIGGTSAG